MRDSDICIHPVQIGRNMEYREYNGYGERPTEMVNGEVESL